MIYVWNRYICPRHTWVNIIIFQCRDKYRTTIEERQAQYDTDKSPFSWTLTIQPRRGNKTIYGD